MSAWETANDWRGSRDRNPGESQVWPIGVVLPAVLARLGVTAEVVRVESGSATRERRHDGTVDWRR